MPAPLPEATATLLGEARDLADSATADFGYPWVDGTGTVVVNVATQRGDRRYAEWQRFNAVAGAAVIKRNVAVNVEQFEKIRDDIASQISKHASGFGHILLVAPDGANSRLILSVNSIDDESLGVLARRYGTELVAVRYEPDEMRPDILAGRFDDRSSPGGFWAGSSIHTIGYAGDHHGCSTAFSWRSLDYTISYMLTAGHCAPGGGTVYTATAPPNFSLVEQMGFVSANTRENWDPAAGTTHLVGDLASPNAYRGDIALIQVMSGKYSAGWVYADPGAYGRSVSAASTSRWSAVGDTFYTDGIVTKEMSNWVVTEVGVDVTYTSGAVFRGGNRAVKTGQCLIAGDSGGPIYTKKADEEVVAKGIISGGGGGGDDNWGGTFDKCTVTFTDIRDPWLGLPGDIQVN